MRSNKQQRTDKKLKYASARKRADKKQREASYSSTYLKIPSGVKMFKPKEGVMMLDILPFRAGEGNPCADEGLLHYERTYHLHARVGADGGSPYLCPRLTSKSPCPICEDRHRMLKKADPDDEKLVKDLAPKERQLFNVINLKEPDKGIQLWDMSYHLFGKLLDARIRNSDEDEGWDQFAALEGGMTLKVGFKEKSFGGRNFLEAETIDFKPRTEDYDEAMLDKAHCLDELLIEPEYEALKEAYLEAAKPSKDEDDEDDEAPVKKKAKPAPVDDEEEEEEDDDEEEAPVKKKSKVVDDEEDEDDEDDEPAPKKKSKPAPADEDEEEEEEEDDDDEDEDDEEPAPKSKKAAPKKDWDDFDEDDEDEKPAKKKSAPVEDDEEEEDEPVKKRKSRAKVKPEPEEEEDAEEEEDDEEPARVKSHKPSKKDDDEDDE